MHDQDEKARHPIRVAAERTGLSPHVLRMWERRYDVVEPERSEGGQRLYSDAEIERLRLLRRATLGGRSIGRVEGLTERELVELIREDERGRVRAPRRRPERPDLSSSMDEALEAAFHLREEEVERILLRTLVTAGIPAFLDEVGAPFLEELAEGLRSGAVGRAEAQLAAAVLRRVVDAALLDLGVPADAPVIVVATPSGPGHEVRALLAAAAARSEGWRVRFLGSDLPAGEVAAVAERTGARAVCLSVALGDGGEPALEEIGRLRDLLAPHVTLLVEGPGARRGRAALVERGAVAVPGPADLRAALPELRDGGE